MLTFSLYYPVVRRIGPAKAAYSSVLVPIIAMGFSTWLEDYQWTSLTVGGALLALGGMAAALSRSRSSSRGSRRWPDALMRRACLRRSFAATPTISPTGELWVEFVTGRRYVYSRVPEEVAEALARAFSKGVYFNTRIRDRFSHREDDARGSRNPILSADVR